jgi:hypothetical protein
MNHLISNLKKKVLYCWYCLIFSERRRLNDPGRLYFYVGFNLLGFRFMREVRTVLDISIAFSLDAIAFKKS